MELDTQTWNLASATDNGSAAAAAKLREQRAAEESQEDKPDQDKPFDGQETEEGTTTQQPEDNDFPSPSQPAS